MKIEIEDITIDKEDIKNMMSSPTENETNIEELNLLYEGKVEFM